MNAVILLTVQIERMLEAYPPVADFMRDLKGQVGWHPPYSMRKAYRRGTSRIESGKNLGRPGSHSNRSIGYSLSPDLRSSYAFMATFTASVVIGSERTRAPEAFSPFAKADPCGLRQ
jgi:hypothetical protein